MCDTWITGPFNSILVLLEFDCSFHEHSTGSYVESLVAGDNNSNTCFILLLWQGLIKQRLWIASSLNWDNWWKRNCEKFSRSVFAKWMQFQLSIQWVDKRQAYKFWQHFSTAGEWKNSQTFMIHCILKQVMRKFLPLKVLWAWQKALTWMISNYIVTVVFSWCTRLHFCQKYILGGRVLVCKSVVQIQYWSCPLSHRVALMVPES